MTTLTNAKVFKGILQYKSSDVFTKEAGYVYFIREFNENNEETGNTEIYFGTRKYGDVNVSQLAEIENILNKLNEISEELKGKQDIINDINEIREGASLGSTALQTIPEEYVTEEKLNETVDSKVFIGTLAEYQSAYAAGKIAVGALVIIMEEGEDSNDAIALLGTAVLGKMILGQK